MGINPQLSAKAMLTTCASFCSIASLDNHEFYTTSMASRGVKKGVRGQGDLPTREGISSGGD